LTSLSTQIKQYNATVEVSQLPNIVADQLAIERILSNLIHNAVIYADPNRKSKIAITGETLDNETWFHVEDNGIGISADDTQKIFDIFQRAGNHTLSGDGMGLSFARSLVQRHGGEVKCESRVGVGSTFSFSIRHHLDVNNDLGSN
jgi:signal transduction histidine kinase